MELLKKPLNILETPVQSFIKRDPPEFRWARTCRKVDVGDTIRERETDVDRFSHYTNALSRSENVSRYGGRRSYRGEVMRGGVFRPPLIPQHLQHESLSRLRRPATILRTNPGSTNSYKTQNGHDLDVSSMIDKRQLNGSIRPSYFLRKECPVDYEVKPDLEYNTPQTCGPSFHTIPINKREETCLDQLELNDNRPHASCFSGINSVYQKQQTTPLEDLDLLDNRPSTHAISGVNGPYTKDSYTPLEDLELIEKTGVKNYSVNPSGNVDFIDYEKKDIQTQNALIVEGINRPKNPLSGNAVRRPNKVNFHTKLSGFGSYNPGVSYPRSEMMVTGAKIRDSHRPSLKGVMAH